MERYETTDRISTVGFARAALALCCEAVFLILLTAIAGSAQTLNVLYNFGSNGYSPGKGITMDAYGRIYGTTQYGGDLNCDGGGPPGCGVVFRLARSGSGWVYTPLYNFTTQYSFSPMDSGVPTVAANGAVYDVTFLGGQYSNGMVFNLRPSPSRPTSAISFWNFDSVYQFTGNNDGGGPSPVSPLVFDANGNIYGAAGGGATGYGVVYELTPSGNGWTESVLYNFTGCADGAYPAGITFDSEGNMYGTTGAAGGQQCGARNGCGTVFKLTPTQSGWTETTLYAFHNGTDGCASGPLYRDHAGNLYGITEQGGPDNNGGTVWELSPADGGWSFNVIYAFNFFTVGYYGPFAPTMDASGNLWGVVNWGGANDTGMLFKMTQANGAWTFTDAYDFSPRSGGAAGCYPNGTPVMDASGNLYGVTQLCGVDEEGTIWEYTP